MQTDSLPRITMGLGNTLFSACECGSARPCDGWARGFLVWLGISPSPWFWSRQVDEEDHLVFGAAGLVSIVILSDTAMAPDRRLMSGQIRGGRDVGLPLA